MNLNEPTQTLILEPNRQNINAFVRHNYVLFLCSCMCASFFRSFFLPFFLFFFLSLILSFFPFFIRSFPHCWKNKPEYAIDFSYRLPCSLAINIAECVVACTHGHTSKKKRARVRAITTARNQGNEGETQKRNLGCLCLQMTTGKRKSRTCAY